MALSIPQGNVVPIVAYMMLMDVFILHIKLRHVLCITSVPTVASEVFS